MVLKSFTASSMQFQLQKQRLDTFKNWPFPDTAICNRTKMAEAGFYCSGGPGDVDSVTCFLCGKQLDGWEESDDPWEEHKSHAAMCKFVQIGKPEEHMTLEEFLEVTKQCMKNQMHRDKENLLVIFKNDKKKLENKIITLGKSAC